MKKRTLVTLLLMILPLLASPTLLAQKPADVLRVGYLKGIVSDSQLWVGEHLGVWQEQGIELRPIQFVTGLEAYQALAGGSVDIVTTGAVISNFPARGQGKAFLINALETGTAQIWVDSRANISSLRDLQGQKVATTRGTTAHFFLHRALHSVGLDSTRDVEIIHQRMDQAVTSFIAGSVPVTAMWVPLDQQIRQRKPDAIQLAQAGDYPDAAVVNGWSASNRLYARNPELLKRFIRGWVKANDFIVANPDQAIEILVQDKHKEFTVDELQLQFTQATWHPSATWRQFYQDGSAYRWFNQVTNFNKEVGAINDPLPAETYFDPKLFLEATN